MQSRGFCLFVSWNLICCRFYGEKILQSIDVDKLREEMEYITSLASPLIISTFKSIIYVDTDRFYVSIEGTMYHPEIQSIT